MKVLAGIAGAILSFVTGLPPIIWALVCVMTLDYITGLICAVVGKSPNTPSGKLSSSTAFLGLLKKAVILLVVALASLLDATVSSGTGTAFVAVSGATSLWFIASEGVSIVENAASIGVPIPSVLRHALEIMKDEADNSDEGEEEDDLDA